MKAPEKACEAGMPAMTQDKVRVNLQVSAELNALWDSLAQNSGASRGEVIRQALALMKVAQDAKKKGKHIGLTSDPSKLDAEIIGLM